MLTHFLGVVTNGNEVCHGRQVYHLSKAVIFSTIIGYQLWNQPLKTASTAGLRNGNYRLLFGLQDLNHNEGPREIPVESKWLMLEIFILLQRKRGVGRLLQNER